MGKLKLQLDALQVDSFPTSNGTNEARGTVRGHETEYNTYWCTAPSSVGPNQCFPTAALGCRPGNDVITM